MTEIDGYAHEVARLGAEIGLPFIAVSADFSNQTIAITVVAGITQSLVFADGTEARDFENVHDLFTGSGNDVLHLGGAADDGFGNLLKTGAGQDTVYGGNNNDRQEFRGS